MFIIEDEFHADWIGQYADRDSAVAKLRELAGLPWDQPPNAAPCTSWRTCGRHYELVEFDTGVHPWRELTRSPALKVSAEGTVWLL